MGIQLTTYVGPYYTVPKDFDWSEWESVVFDGRGQAGAGDDRLILIHNRKLPGVGRVMTVDPHGEQQVAQITPATIVFETAAFGRMAEDFIQHCWDYGIDLHDAWGVVPCWS